MSLLLAASFSRCASGYNCLHRSLGFRLTPNMSSSDQNTLFPEQPALFPSLNAMFAPESSTTFHSSLPPIPEQEWEFDWENTFPLPDPYEGFEQTTTTAVESAANDNTPSQTHEKLATLQNEVQQLRHDIAELYDMFCKRLDNMEKSLVIAQRYVNNLVPWSMEVHEKYSKLLAMAVEQEKRTADRAT